MDRDNPGEQAPIYIIPRNAGDAEEKIRDASLDATELGCYADVGCEGFKHVHFPPEGIGKRLGNLVNVVWLPPPPKKEGIVKKIARQVCCTSDRSS